MNKAEHEKIVAEKVAEALASVEGSEALEDAKKENIDLKTELRGLKELFDSLCEMTGAGSAEGIIEHYKNFDSSEFAEGGCVSCEVCESCKAQIAILEAQLEAVGGAKIEVLEITAKEAIETFVSPTILKDRASANVHKYLIATPSKDGRKTTVAISQTYGGKDELVVSGTFASVAKAGEDFIAKYADALVEVERGKAVFMLPIKAFK